MMITQVVTEPSVEPVTLAELKTYLRGISHTTHDAILNNLITQARTYLEMVMGRAFVQQTRAVYFKSWPAKEFVVPYPPLQSVTSIIYTDVDGTATTWASDEYVVDIVSAPGRVVLGYNESWPTATLHHEEYPIAITYVCGYEPTEDSPADYRTNVPEMIKTAIKAYCEIHYDRPPDVYAGALNRIIDNVINMYRIWGFGA